MFTVYSDVVNEISGGSAPQAIEDFIGQSRVKRQVQIALQACNNDGCRFPHTLALGSPGLGKTVLADLIATERGANYKEAMGNSFTTVSQIQDFLVDAQDGDILFIDEIHELKKKLTAVLYKAIEDRKVYVRASRDAPLFTVPLADFSFIAATTDSYRLLKPLRDRFKLTLHFEFYNPDDIEEIIRNRAKEQQWSCDEKAFPLMASRSKGIPREGLTILENARRMSRAENSQTISLAHLNGYLAIAGIGVLGLGPPERQYLTILSEHNLPVRLSTIAMRMGSLTRNISDTIEPFLFRAGLITRSDKGRMLTSKGVTHVQTNRDRKDMK